MEFTSSTGKTDWSAEKSKQVSKPVISNEEEDRGGNTSLYDQLVSNLEDREEEEKEAGKFKMKTLNQQEADKINQMTYDRYVDKFQKEMDMEKESTVKFQNTTISSDIPEKFQLGTIQKTSDEGKPLIDPFSTKKTSLLDQVQVIIPKKKKKKKKKRRKKRKREVAEPEAKIQPIQKKRKADDTSVNLVSPHYGD